MSDQTEAIPNSTSPGADHPESKPLASPTAAAASPAAPLLMGVKLPIRVLLGRTRLCLRQIAQLTNGAVIELDCCPDDPVEIIVNDRVIAHGQVVVVSGNYGVRITRIASRNENSQPENDNWDLFSLSENLR